MADLAKACRHADRSRDLDPPIRTKENALSQNYSFRRTFFPKLHPLVVLYVAQVTCAGSLNPNRLFPPEHVAQRPFPSLNA